MPYVAAVMSSAPKASPVTPGLIASPWLQMAAYHPLKGPILSHQEKAPWYKSRLSHNEFLAKPSIMPHANPPAVRQARRSFVSG